MKKLLFTALGLLLAPALPSQSNITDYGVVSDVIEMKTNRIHHLYVAPEMNTTVHFRTDAKNFSIVIGEQVIAYDFDPSTRILHVKGLFNQGLTNMNVTIDGETYVFLVHIVTDSRLQYSVNATFPHLEKEQSRFMPPSNAPRMKPFEIDTVSAIRTIERGRRDPVFRQSQGGVSTLPIGKTYYWNQSHYHLVDAHYFPKQDLLVLKAEWTNSTDQAIYLHINQVELWIRNNKVPISARQQNANLLFPGQRDVHWFFIQGFRIGIDNPWEIRLPPDASAVRRLLGR